MPIRLSYFGLGGMVILVGLLISCQGVNSANLSNNESEKPTVTVPSKSMIIEGKIVEVMESSPLQLSVDTQAGRYHVDLLSETKIIKQGQAVAPGVLIPGLQIQIEAESLDSNKLAVIAKSIEIK